MLDKKLILALAVVSLFIHTHAWATPDTTLVDCSTLSPDSLRIECLIEQGQYWWNKSDSARAMPLGRAAYRASLATGNVRQQGHALRVIAYSFYMTGSYDSAAVYAERAVHTFLSEDYFSEASRLYNDWGNSLRDQGQLKESSELYFKAIALNESLGRDSLNTAPYFNIATVFLLLDDHEKHDFYVKKANRLAKQYEQARLSVISDLALSSVYEKNNQLDSANYHARAALEGGWKMKNNVLVAYAYSNLANVAEAAKAFEEAEGYFKEAIEMEDVPVFDNTRFKFFLGSFYQRQERYDEANTILLDGIRAAEQIGARNLVSSFLSILPETLSARREYKLAYEYLDRLFKENEQKHEDQLKEKVNEMDIQYETLQKEKENLALRTQNAEQSVTLAEEKARGRQRLLIASLLGFFLLGTILAFIFYQRQIQQKEAILVQETLIKDQKLTQLQQEQKIVAFKSMITGEESERKRLAKELHDGLGGMLSNLKLALSPPEEGAKLGTEGQESILPHALDMADRASEELRRIAHNMMPQSLAKFGLITALEDLCDDINFAGTMEVTFQHFNVDDSQVAAINLAVYRLVQELLNNVVKHAEATEVTVQLSQNATTLLVTVEDNGKGFDLEKAMAEKGHGLSNLQSRVEALTGELEIDTRPDEGTSVQIQLPINRED